MTSNDTVLIQTTVSVRFAVYSLLRRHFNGPMTFQCSTSGASSVVSVQKPPENWHINSQVNIVLKKFKREQQQRRRGQEDVSDNRNYMLLLFLFVDDDLLGQLNSTTHVVSQSVSQSSTAVIELQ